MSFQIAWGLSLVVISAVYFLYEKSGWDSDDILEIKEETRRIARAQGASG